MRKNSKGFAPVIILLLLLLVGFVAIGITKFPVAYKSAVALFNYSPSTSPTLIISATPSATPSGAEYKIQEKEILAQFTQKNSSVRVSNQVGNYATIEEHAIPYGGGDWCVVKKDSDKWTKVFCSQDEVWCGLNEQYNLPTGLLLDCVNPSPNISQ